jgi:phosphoribosylpyrophosphate synthetase
MLFSDDATGAAEEVAGTRILISPCVIRRFGSGEIYIRPEESVRGSDVFVIQTRTINSRSWSSSS